MTTTESIERLREALAAGPTPGPWITAGPSFGDPLPRHTTCIVQDTDDDCAPDVVRFMVEERDEQHETDAAYIAAADPATIAALLAAWDEREALRKDAERYRWLRAQHWSTSPLAVVCDPKDAVKIGRTCPSGDYLDTEIDAMKEPQ